MQLSDLENEVLVTLQQPGANPGGVPAWGTLVNPQFNQATVDGALNRAYIRLMSELSDLDLYTQSVTINSVANTSEYAIPGAGNPAIVKVRRVFYSPLGLNYTLEFIPGLRLVSWAQFQKYTGSGYLRNASYGVQPDVATIRPERGKLAFYPGSAQAGDTITLEYACIPTAGAAGCPTLVNAADTPVLPDDAQMAIVYGALGYHLWAKAREFVAMQEYQKMYRSEVEAIRQRYARLSSGDGFQFDDASSFGAFYGNLMPEAR